MDNLANRYALAIFDIALENNLVKDYQEQVKLLSQIFKDNPDYLRVLSSCFLSKDEKHHLIDEAFASVSIKPIISLLKVIIDNHRVNEIPLIFQEFNSICNEHFHIEEGIVYSVIPLTDEQILKIEKTIEHKSQKKVSLINKIDERLISGIKVVIQDRIYDSSLLHRIDSLKKDILKKGR